MVLRRTLLVATVGALVGLPAAVVTTRALQALLFGVAPTDPLSLSISTVLLIGVGLFAAWLPAERAARVDPTHTLRYE
jgi:ABC-type antimicrobial peptide transport system permease subunit